MDQQIPELNEFSFCSFVRHLLWKPDFNHHLFCGSFFELPLQYVIQNFTDIDRMMINADTCAIPWEMEAPTCFRGSLLRIDPRHTPPGFAKIMRLTCITDRTFYIIDRKNLHGPARKVALVEWLGTTKSKLDSIVAITGMNISDLMSFTLDEVEAVVCPYWPAQAEGWRTRQTRSGWPGEELREKVIDGGCHLVAKPHYSNSEDSEIWRFSFSLAELILIRSWNDVQKYVYHLLRIIKRRVSKECETGEKSAFGNYLFKTLMFWACEEKPAEFWNEDQIESSVGELLCSAVECLIERKCPQYFIPDNNIIGCSEDVDCSGEIELLLAYDCEKIRQLRMKFPKLCGDLSFRVPDRLILHCKLQVSKHLIISPVAETVQPYYAKDFSQDVRLRLELGDLYEGVRKHLAFKSSKDDPKRKSLIVETEEHYGRSVGNDFESQVFAELIYLRDDVHSIIQRCVESKRKFTIESTDSSSEPFAIALDAENRSNEHKKRASTWNPTLSKRDNSLRNELKPCLQNCLQKMIRSQKASDYNSEQGSDYISTIIELFINHFLRDCLRSPSFIISSSFLANFYYAQLKDYQKAIEICSEVLNFAGNDIDGLKLNFAPYLEGVFQMYFCTEVMPLFDEDIQTVCGFVSLFLSVDSAWETNPSSTAMIPTSLDIGYSATRPTGPMSFLKHKNYWSPVVESLLKHHAYDRRFVAIQISSVQFLKYIGQQCRKYLGLGRDPLFDIFQDYTVKNRLLRHCVILESTANITTRRLAAKT